MGSKKVFRFIDLLILHSKIIKKMGGKIKSPANAGLQF
ncbi:hypothetical protein A33Q_4209 [Indibacter alkaliphilus LW1]|uniref:Uncharacterized protein n=1 Tax=Indibacter alkaliphilus (strain CCUG 57479 / KCTC 22604 / LW1) TaxID=1189612 RepID=S2DJH2_INDAL|nr:hypothetical protein A33Q_4209 [Indibacter alkaliphilus LW1]